MGSISLVDASASYPTNISTNNSWANVIHQPYEQFSYAPQDSRQFSYVNASQYSPSLSYIFNSPNAQANPVVTKKDTSTLSTSARQESAIVPQQQYATTQSPTAGAAGGIAGIDWTQIALIGTAAVVALIILKK